MLNLGDSPLVIEYPEEEKKDYLALFNFGLS